MVRDSRTLSRNTAWASLASLVQFGITAVVLALLTFEFEPARFGEFIAALSLIFFVAPFAGLGAPNLLHKRFGADGVRLEDAVAKGRGMVLVGGPVWVLAIVLLGRLLLPDIDWVMVVLLAIAELIAISYVDTMQAAVQATETLELSVVMKAAQSGLRLVSVAVLLLVFDEPTLRDWAALYLVAAVVSMVVAEAVVRRHVSVTTRLLLPTVADAREGIGLTMGWGTERLRTDADKVLLVNMGFGADAGLYGAANRMLQIVYVPIRGAIAASLARFWRGANTPGSSTAFAKQLARVAGLYGLGAGAVVALGSPLVPFVLGDGYDETSQVLLWLTPLPFLMALQAFPATALTSEGMNRSRVMLVLGATAFNVVLNLLLIPNSGWRGAVAATLITEVILTVGLWVVLLRADLERDDLVEGAP